MKSTSIVVTGNQRRLPSHFMEAPFFHLLDLLNRPDGPMLVGTVVVGLTLMGGFFYWAYRKQVHPIVAWLLLAATLFAVSQIFQQNHEQWLFLLLMDLPLTAILVWRVNVTIRKQKNTAEGRQRVTADAEEARAEYREGNLKPMSVDEVMREIGS